MEHIDKNLPFYILYVRERSIVSEQGLRMVVYCCAFVASCFPALGGPQHLV